jgi:hypothetical protein
MCLLPLHVRFSASEDLFVPATLFATWSLALLAHAFRAGDRAALWAGGLAMVLAVESRPELLALPAYAIALLFVAAPRGAWRARLRSPHLWGAAALAAALCAPRLWTLLQPGGGLSDARLEGASALALLTHQVVFDARVTPAALWGLAALGLAASVRTNARAAAFVALALLALGATSLSFFDNEVYRERTQVLAAPIFAMLAGGAADALFVLLRTARAAWRAAASCAAAAVVAASFHAHLPYVRASRDQQDEWRFLRDAVPKVPLRPGDALLALTHNEGHRWLGAFPWFLLARARPGVEIVNLRDAVEGDALPAARADRALWFYQGLYCFYAYEDEPAPAPLSTRCAGVHARYELEPVVTARLTSGPYAPIRYSPGPVEIGFFRVRGERITERSGRR